ncbi:hypothetical protein PG990_005980 [Apiospora arundinis]|uniref:Ferric reductase transmembrane component n=1 Tax=Apiospora arundinis TaxID=335852 RepID=A0ABR2J8Y4_9PEZI
MDETGTPWARHLLRASLRYAKSPLSPDDVAVTDFTDDPEKVEYIRILLYEIMHGRDVVACYNLLLSVVLVGFTARHFIKKRRDQQRWEEKTQALRFPKQADKSISSSSSSTLQGIPSPPDAVKPDADLERQPLLASTARPAHQTITNAIRAWLMYQPRPVSFINRTLPSNETSLLVLAYVALNIFFQFFQSSLEPKYFFAFADRIGYVFIVNLPLLYLLSAKNQPLRFLTGYSYESLNIFHRRVGELMCFAAFAHTVTFVIWQVWCCPDWLLAGDLLDFLMEQRNLLGMISLIAYELLYATSLASFRAQCYELFLASHVILQVVAMLFLYLHFFTSRPYVLTSLAIFLIDRLVWRLSLKSESFTADLEILEDEQTMFLSANWSIPHQSDRPFRSWSPQSIRHGWKPMDHVFITIPSLGRTHSLQTHPFTIASAAPRDHSALETETPQHAWLSLLIRARDGFTHDLLQYSLTHSSVSVRIDGPYGSAEALEMLRACDSRVLIAGGSGIAVVFPLAWALAQQRPSRSGAQGRRQDIHLLWVVHSRSHLSWLPQERLDELAEAGIQVTIPGPTAEAGRPDIAGYLAEMGTRAQMRQQELGVVVSGPDNLNRAARNACALAVKDGAKIRLSVEKFGW